LGSLGTQDSGDIDLSIIVVVDGDAEGAEEAIRSLFPTVTIIRGDGNWWWTKSVNEGCKLAIKNGADVVLLLNDDIRLDPGYLRQVVKAIENEPHAIIGSLNITRETGPRIYFSGAKRVRWWDGKLERYHPFLAPYEGNLTGLHRTIVCPGRGLCVPTPVFEKIGYFDERAFPQYKADYDFTLRANKRHIPCSISWDAVIYVQVAATGVGATFTRQPLSRFISSLFKKHSRSGLYRNFLYYKRHYPVWGLLVFPFTALMVLIRQFYLFFKEKKY
jgi:GT2 family glycosyltransferase